MTDRGTQNTETRHEDNVKTRLNEHRRRRDTEGGRSLRLLRTDHELRNHIEYSK